MCLCADGFSPTSVCRRERAMYTQEPLLPGSWLTEMVAMVAAVMAEGLGTHLS